MTAFVSLLSNGIRSNPSTLKSHIPAHRHLPLKYSKRCLNLHQLKNGHNRAKKSMAVSTSLGIEPDEIYKRGGTGVLERPELEQRELKLPVIRDKTPTPDEGGEIGKSKEKRGSGGGERYKVLLLDHEQHTETQVAAILPKVVPSVTLEEAKKCFHEARKRGESLVTVAVKEHAEFYAQMMARCGLRSAIEPDGDVT